ncbi:MAG TPA: WD40 repeat domain-containing protein, partial [Verrucomicrobiota bacterium]|nr:WD40 repeat domain-containing protein [Verrucomicrobiota bacterium]
VMKCLEKDRGRRYETANGLAADINRHLNHEPVVARPPGAAYRFQKLVRRHRLAFAAAAVVTAVLVLGIAVSTGLAVRATRAQKEESRQRQAAEEARREESRQRGLAEETSRQLRQTLYVADMGVAWRSWAEGDAERARRLLEKYRAAATPADDPRGFEWRYLWGLSRPDELLILTNGASCVKYSPDGRLLALADYNSGEVRLWDVAAQRMLRSFRPFERSVFSVAFSPDGKVLATASRGDPDFKFWDVGSGTLVATLPGRTQENVSVVFSPDGRRVATAAVTPYRPVPAEVKLWDFASRKELMSLPGLTSFVMAADFSPDGGTLAVGDGEGFVRLWNLATGAVRTLAGHRGFILPVRFAPVGGLLASADENGAIMLWDWESGRLMRVLTGHEGPVNSLAVSADGRRLASGGRDHTTRLWDLNTGAQLARWLGHASRAWSVDFSPDGRTLVTGGLDETVRFWRAAPKPESEILTRTHGGNGIGFSPDGRFLFVDEWETNQLVEAHRVTLWEPGSKTVAHRLPGRDLTYSPDGRIMALVQDDTNVVVYEAATMRQRGTIPGPGRLTGGKAISPDGRRLALRSDGRPVVMDLEALRVVATLESGSKESPPLLFSRDGRTLIAADSPDGAVRLWDTTTWQTRGWLRGHRAGVGALALSPDGRLLASASGTTILLWDLAGGALAEDPVLQGNSGAIGALAFSPDGRTLAAGSFDGPISLWSVPGRQEIGSLKAHLTAVWGTIFSPDGRTLASTSYDYTVRLWR